MSENNPTQENTEALALTYAFVALVKSLKLSGNLDTDHLFQNLNAATTQLERLGKNEAATYIKSTLSEQLRRL